MTQSLLTPTLSPAPSGLTSAAASGSLPPAFCEQNRAIVATFLHTQSAMLSMIQSIARVAVDGQGDMEETLRSIDLVATKACQESNMMAVAVSSIRINNSL